MSALYINTENLKNNSHQKRTINPAAAPAAHSSKVHAGRPLAFSCDFFHQGSLLVPFTSLGASPLGKTTALESSVSLPEVVLLRLPAVGQATTWFNDDISKKTFIKYMLIVR